MRRSRLIPVVVELAPGGTLRDVAGGGGGLVWVDVSRSVRLGDGIEVSRGLAGNGYGASAGMLSLTVDNRGGDYDEGRFGGFTLRDMPIRVRHLGARRDYAEGQALFVDYGSWSAAEASYFDAAAPAVLWSGAVSSAAVSFAGGHVPVVRLSGVDVVQHFERVASRPLPLEVMVRRYGAEVCHTLNGEAPLGSAVEGEAVPLNVVSFGWPGDDTALDARRGVVAGV